MKATWSVLSSNSYIVFLTKIWLSQNTIVERSKKASELALGDSRITLAEIEPTFKITCAMLSLMWTLYRLGVYDGNEISNVVTVIDEKYMKVEEKVITMLKYIQENRNHDYISSVDYWFYQT